MLNEILEYEQYISKDTVRLGARGLNNKLGGYVRALTIIARHFLFAENEENPINNIESTIECLKAWLGFEYDNAQINKFAKEEIDYIANCFPEYINNKAKSEEHKKVLKSILETKKTTLLFNFYTNPQKKTNEKNSMKSITYESIIADALNQGALKKYLFRSKGNKITEDIVKTSLKNNVSLSEEDEDIIPKLTAFYMLAKKRTKKDYIVITGVDIINWSNKDSDFNSKNWLSRFKYNGTALFDKDTVAGNIIKIKINEDWIKEHEMEIVSYSDYNPNDGFTYYEDMGANKPLAIYSGSRCGDE